MESAGIGMIVEPIYVVQNGLCRASVVQSNKFVAERFVIKLRVPNQAGDDEVPQVA